MISFAYASVTLIFKLWKWEQFVWQFFLKFLCFFFFNKGMIIHNVVYVCKLFFIINKILIGKNIMTLKGSFDFCDFIFNFDIWNTDWIYLHVGDIQPLHCYFDYFVWNKLDRWIDESHLCCCDCVYVPIDHDGHVIAEKSYTNMVN